MSAITWSENLALAEPTMDATHREFVALIGSLEKAAPGEQTAAALAALREHTVEHFAQEERWMASMGFGPAGCHSQEHASVLEVVREVERRYGAAPAEAAPFVGTLVTALAQWFPIHAASMDAALAMTMHELGFDPDAGTIANPRAADAPPLQGCGTACAGAAGEPG